MVREVEIHEAEATEAGVGVGGVGAVTEGENVGDLGCGRDVSVLGEEAGEGWGDVGEGGFVHGGLGEGWF